MLISQFSSSEKQYVSLCRDMYEADLLTLMVVKHYVDNPADEKYIHMEYLMKLYTQLQTENMYICMYVCGKEIVNILRFKSKWIKPILASSNLLKYQEVVFKVRSYT